MCHTTPVVSFAVLTPEARRKRDSRRRRLIALGVATLVALPSPVRLAIEEANERPTRTGIGTSRVQDANHVRAVTPASRATSF